MTKVTQEMIRLYDEYTHITLDRRRFMERLTIAAGSAAAAGAILPLIEANQAAAAMIAADDPRLVSETVAFKGATGEVKGYLVRPKAATGKLPAVVVIHENRGLNEYTRDVARRVATEGFLALAVDFLSPAGGTPADEDKARDMIGQLNGDDTIKNAVAAVDFLDKHAMSTGKVGVVGFCWGGRMANMTAVNAATRRRRRLLRPGAARGGRAEDQGQAAAALCRAGRAHQRRHPGVRGGAEGRRHGLHALQIRQRQPRLPQRHGGSAL